VASCSSGGSPAAAPATTTGRGFPTTSVTEAAAPAPAGFRAVTVTVRSADGTESKRCLLMADTQPLQEQGLMGVTDPALGGYDGMIFVFGADTTSAFWMKNTLIPLSIAFADRSGSVVSTADMVPCPEGTASCPLTKAGGPYRYAVEVAVGGLPTLGLVDGASLDPTFGPACRR
jgi:hypothetical protein